MIDLNISNPCCIPSKIKWKIKWKIQISAKRLSRTGLKSILLFRDPKRALNNIGPIIIDKLYVIFPSCLFRRDKIAALILISNI